MAQVVTHATLLSCAQCDPYMPKLTTVRFICEFCSERVGGPRKGLAGGKNLVVGRYVVLEPKWIWAQDYERASRRSRTSLTFQLETFITRSGIIPPPTQGPRLEGGRGRNCYGHNFRFYLFSTTIAGPRPHSQLGCQPTHPPELKQVAYRLNTR